MARDWQQWLSPRPRRRTATASEPRILAAYDVALFEFLKEEDGRWVVRETHYIDNEIVRGGLSGPLLHIHWLQTEYFQVEQGVIGIMKNEKEVVATQEDGIVKIPPGTRHRFWAHSSGTEDLIFKVWAEPQGLNNSFDENFLRNFVGYQRDCQKENITPSVFQLMLMSYYSSTIATPPFWMPIWILISVQYVLAVWVGAYVLGYEASYPEYNSAEKSQSRNSKKSI
ncbi:hypothetical protein P280DRAFT_466909 [Massarina eburnea CBS 473.64]|uniref:Cupin 2 conserved barrel domain-containing protein n=1 Tax=Massarina eburnea CBS 473.64 TaxID=1395130 RepID=A0A6A6SAJ2_9PLEO|nr:hypothetical protein P280DRAFT_466909 [Massarina eburnea CBS 473.64]